MCILGGSYINNRQGYARKRTLKLAGYFLVGLKVPRPFSKPPTTRIEQLQLLKQRGMTIADDQQALHWLAHVNYYRMRAYWLPFESDRKTHRFFPGTDMQVVIDLYVFDRELRLLVLDAIERLEVSIRAHWAYQMAHAHGPHGHLDSALARNTVFWQKNLDQLQKEVQRSEEPFIQHFGQAYAEPLAPVWVCCEVMSLGLLSRWYGNLKSAQTRRLIAGSYGLDEAVLESWLHHLTYLRNICAHHSRLWNRELTIVPMLPRSKPAVLRGQMQPANRRIYNALLMLKYLMDVIAPGHRWHARLKNLIASHSVNTAAMGFPADWVERTIWAESKSA